MGKPKKSEEADKKMKVRVHHKAGLHLSMPKLKRAWREKINRRMQKNVMVIPTACTEFVLLKLLQGTSEHLGETTHMKPEHLFCELNNPKSPVYGVFPKNVGGLHQ